jgi:hypothetical protein
MRSDVILLFLFALASGKWAPSHSVIDLVMATACRDKTANGTASSFLSVFEGEGTAVLSYDPASPHEIAISYCMMDDIGTCSDATVDINSHDPDWAPAFMYCDDELTWGVTCSLVDPSAIWTSAPPGVYCRPALLSGNLQCIQFDDTPWSK